MSRSILLLLVLASLAMPLRAEDAVIIVREVEVRGGPSEKFYVTGKLQQGDRVEIVGESYGYVHIVPPLGSYSLVLKDAVQSQPGNTGAIEQEGVETIVGSPLVAENNIRGRKLNRGQKVTIVGEVAIEWPGGVRSYYKITPVNEARFIPANSIQRSGSVLPASGPAPATQTRPEWGHDHHGDEITAALKRADEAYRVAEQTGDWSTPRRLYEELAKCANHDARLIAWNRLDSMRKKSPTTAAPASSYYPAAPSSAVSGPPAPAAPAVRSGGWQSTPAGSAGLPRSSSVYTYSNDSPRQAAPPSPNPTTPPNPSRYSTSAPPAPSATGLVGRLRRARQTVDGRPLYFLEDSRGNLRCYVAPATGLNLEPFLHQNISLNGSPFVYHMDLRSYHLTAVQVTPLAN